MDGIVSGLVDCLGQSLIVYAGRWTTTRPRKDICGPGRHSLCKVTTPIDRRLTTFGSQVRAPGQRRVKVWKRALESDVKNEADILNLRPSQVLEHRYQIEQLIIVRIRKPTADGDGVLWVEYV